MALGSSVALAMGSVQKAASEVGAQGGAQGRLAHPTACGTLGHCVGTRTAPPSSVPVWGGKCVSIMGWKGRVR